jgi:hypothetical protein
MFYPHNQVYVSMYTVEEKKMHGSWENVWEYFSSHQWKGERIDGRVSPRTGVSEEIVLTPCVDTRSVSVWWGNVCNDKGT